jgi:riboflavin synthase
MFTGIVQATGRVVSLRTGSQDRDLIVACPALTPRLFLGASVALDGVCQTVTALEGERFTVHAIAETLRVTTLGERREGDLLNLELPLGAGEPMGGHFVQGHVDGMATILDITAAGQSQRWRFRADPELLEAMVPKGSVALDGISLTLGPQLERDRFEVFLIPHTLEVTTLGAKRPGDRVNVETDILGKYLLRYLDRVAPGGSVDGETLRRTGFDD